MVQLAVTRTETEIEQGLTSLQTHYISGTIFTALHAMQTRSSDENSVCLCVCLSVTRVIPDKKEERYVQIFIPYERIFILVF